MRIGIREQLGFVVLFVALVPLAVLAIAVWVNSHAFITNITKNSLSLTASLKASQIASDLTLIQSTCGTIVTRILIQDALKSFYSGNRTLNNWTAATNDVSGALASGGLSALLQVTVFSRNGTGNQSGLFNVTGNNVDIQLPGTAPNGSVVMLGDPDYGYPSMLYPNISYAASSTPDPADHSINGTTASAFADFPLNATSSLLLGPLQINNVCVFLSPCPL
jgi:osomolarity two-component system sensor histidine kinase SLN1